MTQKKGFKIDNYLCVNHLFNKENEKKLDYWNKHNFGLFKNYPIFHHAIFTTGQADIALFVELHSLYSQQSKYRKSIFAKGA